MQRIAILLFCFIGIVPLDSFLLAQEPAPDSPEAITQAFERARQLSSRGDFFSASALYFNIYTTPNPLQVKALSALTESLIRARLYNAASYFFIKTLQTNHRPSIQHILSFLPMMLDEVSLDLLRKYVLRHTSHEDYDFNTRAHFYYFLGKDELLKGNAQAALHVLNKISLKEKIAAPAAYLRGSAFAILGQSENALLNFKSCARVTSRDEDLKARCTAGVARVYYQKGAYQKAEEIYDEIPKSSFVWADILFEQAWNSYAQGDYNRALGKLVTYKSPSLKFVFNPEVDVLRAQSFLALCYDDDANKTINEFHATYSNVGIQLKNFLLQHDRDFGAFYEVAKQAIRRKLHTQQMFDRALNRFIRGPYFTNLIRQERKIRAELNRLQDLGHKNDFKLFSEFLEKVLSWRVKTVRLLGGLFVRNSLQDLYQDLINNLDKVSFIKLEMLKRTKQALEKKPVLSEDEDGVLKKGIARTPRQDHQYFWSFNGEFWADELGDYIFALESLCGT